MIDPSKHRVSETAASCHTEAMRVIMVTGDHKNTAVAIRKGIRIFKDIDQIVKVIDLAKMHNY